jgi:hypothetical protein
MKPRAAFGGFIVSLIAIGLYAITLVDVSSKKAPGGFRKPEVTFYISH